LPNPLRYLFNSEGGKIAGRIIGGLIGEAVTGPEDVPLGAAGAAAGGEIGDALTGGDSTTLFHGTDANSADDILATGFDMNQAAELGGGDELWTSTSASDSVWFAQANPAGGEPALLRIEVPNPVIEGLSNNNLLTIEGSVYRFQPGAMNTLNNSARISLEPLP
jgi:hypothetical protein